VGSAAGGALVALAGPRWALAAGSAAFLLSAGLLAAMRIGTDKPSGREHVLMALRTGWREFRSRRWVWSTVAQFSLVNACFQGPLMVLGPVIADRRFGGAPFWATMMALYAVGLAAGSIAALKARPDHPSSYDALGSFALGPVGAALAAPLALLYGTAAVFLGCGVLLTIAATAVLASRQTRNLTWISPPSEERSSPGRRSDGASRSASADAT